MDKIQSNKYVVLCLCGLLAATIVIILLLGLVPPVSRDALTHHLFIPKLYLKHGGIYEIPEIPFSYYPMLLDYLYMIPLAFGNDTLPKSIHFGFALLTGWLIYRFLVVKTAREYALFGLLFWLTIPLIIKLSVTAYVDLGLVFFITLSILLIFRWLETHSHRYLIIGGAACGLAAGVKYNGIVAILLLSLLVVLFTARAFPKMRGMYVLSAGLFFLMACLVTFSPWLARNTYWTGNPVFPLYSKYFPLHGEQAAVKEKFAERHEYIENQQRPSVASIFNIRRHVYGENVLEMLFLPLRIFFQGQDDNPRLFDGQLNPFLLLLPFGFLLGRKGKKRGLQDRSDSSRQKAFLVTFILCFFLYTVFTIHLRLRYIAPILPPLLILAVLGLWNIELVSAKFLGKHRSLIRLFLMAVILSPNFYYISQLFQTIDPLPYVSGKISRNEYIEKFRPEYPLIQYVNHSLPNDAKVACFYLGGRGYYFDPPVLFASLNRASLFSYNPNPKLPTVAELTQLCRELKISHFIIRNDLFFNQREKELSPEFRAVLDVFFQSQTRYIKEANGYVLLALTKRSDAS